MLLHFQRGSVDVAGVGCLRYPQSVDVAGVGCLRYPQSVDVAGVGCLRYPQRVDVAGVGWQRYLGGGTHLISTLSKAKCRSKQNTS